MGVADRIEGAFPSAVESEAGAVAARMASEGATLSDDSFSVAVDGETVTIPERLYVERTLSLPSFSGVTQCLLTRHHSGFVRQHALRDVLRLDEPWAVPFIIRLAGEYVIEIVEQIDEAFAAISPEKIGCFVSYNPGFVRLTRARVTSYWDCYFRSIPRDQHVGFRLMDRIEAASKLCG